MTAAEIQTMDMLHKKGKTPQEVVAKLQADRAKRGATGPSQSAVYRFLGGGSYLRVRQERRGRKKRLPPRLVQVANAQRLKLLREAGNEYLVTWGDVHKATRKVFRDKGVLRGCVRMPAADYFARVVRKGTAIRARPGKKRIVRTREHETKRHAQAKKWQKYPKSWWEKDIHAYIDNKKFVLARTAKHKKMLRASRVHHHLRTPSEGTEPTFILPKKNRMLLGIPCLDITAAVAQDRIIMWHVNEGRWNGESAAKMYAKLGEALRTTWGNKRSFRVVEDGDTKGFQSSKGKRAKIGQKIESWMLPPRTPGWMPLDFCLWDEIEGRALAKPGRENETQKAYASRLRRTALGLPRDLVKACLSKMRENILATLDAGGKNTQLD